MADDKTPLRKICFAILDNLLILCWQNKKVFLAFPEEV